MEGWADGGRFVRRLRCCCSAEPNRNFFRICTIIAAFVDTDFPAYLCNSVVEQEGKERVNYSRGNHLTCRGYCVYREILDEKHHEFRTVGGWPDLSSARVQN